MDKEIKSLQQILKSISSLNGIDISDAGKFLLTLLKHTLILTNTGSAFLVKKREPGFTPRLTAVITVMKNPGDFKKIISSDRS